MQNVSLACGPVPLGEKIVGTTTSLQRISTSTISVSAARQPNESIDVTMYVVVSVGLAKGDSQLPQLSPSSGLQK